MPPLSAADLARMRSVSQSTMTSTAAIQELVKSRSVTGAMTDTWQPAAGRPNSVKCELVARRGPGEVPEGGQPTSVTFWHVRFPFGTDVRPTDRLVIDGSNYDVTDVDTSKSNALTVTANCRRSK